MIFQSQTARAPAAQNSYRPLSHLLQRKCGRGGSPGLGGECAESTEKKHDLQHKIGNQSAQGAGLSRPHIPVVQRKLTIAGSSDPLEQEADRVADQVLAASANPAVSGASKHLTGQATGETATVPANVDSVLASPGLPLEPALLHDMEQRFGHDFSRVRVHSGAAAEQSARDVSADAYTVGREIVFGASELRPASVDGRRLIAHELTHVVQQTGVGADSNIGRILQRKPRGGTRDRWKKKSIMAIHAEPGSREGAIAYVTGEMSPRELSLDYNSMSEGSYPLVLRDRPETPQTDYEREDGGELSIGWRRPPDLVPADRIQLEVQPGAFDFDAYANAEFEAVQERIKTRLTKRGAPELRTAEEKLGFVQFAETLEAEGVKDEELILFQERNQGGIDPRRPFDWAYNWRDAVDAVLGARGELQKAAEENAQMFEGFGMTFKDTPKDAFSLYEASLSNSMLTSISEEELAAVGLNRDAFEANRGSMLAEFDERLRMETSVALDRFEGALLLAREQLLQGTDVQQKFAAAREAANTDEIRGLKSQKEIARIERDEAKRENVMAHFYFEYEKMKETERIFGEKQTAYTESREAYRAAIESASGIKVTALYGLDEDRFFFEGSAAESQTLLESYVAEKLRDVTHAREVLDEDPDTIYHADILIKLTKARLGVTQGSEIDRLVNQAVEERTDSAWWEKLLDVLSFALIFVPGGAAIVAARLAVSGAQFVSTIDKEALKEILARAGTNQEGGSAGSIILSGVGAAFDVMDAAKIGAKAAGSVLGDAKLVHDPSDLALEAGPAPVRPVAHNEVDLPAGSSEAPPLELETGPAPVRPVAHNEVDLPAGSSEEPPLELETGPAPVRPAAHNEVDLPAGSSDRPPLELETGPAPIRPVAHNEVDLPVSTAPPLKAYRGRRPPSEVTGMRAKRPAFRAAASAEVTGTHRRTGMHYNEVNAAEMSAGVRVATDPVSGQIKSVEFVVRREAVDATTQTKRAFATDVSTDAPQSLDSAYLNSGFDRGHLVQREAMRGDADVERAADLFSTVAPMSPNLNRGAGSAWRASENRAMQLADQHGSIRVKVEPLYALNPQKLSDGTPIPYAFRRQLIAPDGQVLENLDHPNQ